MNSQRHAGARTTSLYIQSPGERSVKIALRLTNTPFPFVVRITGGHGKMPANDAEGMYDLFADALEGFGGRIIVGGLRMITKEGGEILPSVAEIPTRIRAKAPNIVVLGIVPVTTELKIVPGLGMLVAKEAAEIYNLVVHPDQDECLLVQQSVDSGVEWEAGYRVCMDLIQDLRNFASRQSVLISYNGGRVTKKEVVETANRGWPVVLIKGSGRTSDELAGDKDFLQEHPNVSVAEKTSQSLRGVLAGLGVLNIST